MPPIHASLKLNGAGTDAPRLEIGGDGVANVVFPEAFEKKHHERIEDIETGRLVTEDGGSAQAAFPGERHKNLGPGPTSMDAIHLRIGNHQESYLRTKLVDLDEPAGSANGQGEPMQIDDETDEDYVNSEIDAFGATTQIMDGPQTENPEDENDYSVVAGRASVASGIESAQAETAGVIATLQAPDLPSLPAPWQLNAVAPPVVSEHFDEEILADYPFLRDTEILYLLARGAAIRAHDYWEAQANGQHVFPLTLVHENAEESILGLIFLPTYPGFPPVPVPWKPSNIPQYLELFGGGARPQPDLVQRRALEERLEREYHQQVQRHEIVAEPAISSVVFMKLADRHTRLRYSSEILTIKGEKFVRLDKTHFLYAVNVEYLLEGDNTTLRRRAYTDWPPFTPLAEQYGRAPRPEVLFALYPKGLYEYTSENSRRKKAPQEFRPQCDIFGRVVLNAEDRPLKFSVHMPYTVSTEIEGWEMEALCRIDPDLCNQDFIDRMLPDTALDGKVRPAKGTLSQRRRRDRMRMRVLPWPVPAELGYSDQQIIKQLSEEEIERNNTLELRDLSKEEIEVQEAIMYGGHFERSGANNALNDDARLEQFRANLALVRTRFAEDSEEVGMVKERVVSLLTKLGREYDPAVWDAGVKA